MPDITLSYQGSNIATMSSSGTKTMKTSGKYCEDDITLTYVKPSGTGTLLCTIGDYFGTMAGDTTTSLSITLNGNTGNTALLVVMHRDTITLPSDWTFISTTAGGGNYQFISLYKKQISSTSESYTITQASSVRMCANVLYFNTDIDVSLYQTLEMDDYTTYRYTVPARDDGKIELDIMNNYYGASSSSTWTMSARLGYSGTSWFIGSTTGVIARMFVVFNNLCNTTYQIADTTTTTSSATESNRLHRFTIEQA